MPSILSFALSTLWLLAACSAGSPPLSKSDADPSNPQAAGGPAIQIASAHSEDNAPSGHAHANKYTCSMHPEVTADAPGRCPKCGMDLVPTK